MKSFLVIGECCTDIFVYGEAKRLSPEAPVPVFEPKRVVKNMGMAGNVVKNLDVIIDKFQDNNNMLKQEYAKIIPFDRLTLYYVEYDLESIKYLRETEWVLCRNDFIINKVEQNDNIRVIKFSENYRFKFKFNKINREIEYFKTGSEDFFDTVA